MELDKRLEQDSVYIGELKSGQLRMIRDGENEWFLIIPAGGKFKEILDLNQEQQHNLMHDINLVSKLVKEHTQCDKLNVAALGNMVPQLHIHVIARYQHDRAWPGPIWGTQASKAFDASVVEVWSERFNNA